MKRFLSLLIVFSVGVPYAGYGASFWTARSDGGQPGTFLDFAANARSLGMGKAHTAVADDASAPYWNPAGLSQIYRNNVVAQYTNLETDARLGYVGYALPTVDYGTFGVGLLSLDSNGYSKRGESGENLGTFDESDMAMMLGYGYRVAPRWSVGGGLKAIHQKIDSHQDTGFGVDGGLMWHQSPTMQMGLMLKNLLAPELRLMEDEEKYPREIILGTKWSPLRNWLFAADLNQSERKALKLNIGAEWSPAGPVVIRFGGNETELSAGLGMKIGDWRFDYALGYHQAASNTTQLPESHRFGVTFQFGQNIVEEGASVRWQKKGQAVLQRLALLMDQSSTPNSTELDQVLEEGESAVRHQGFPNPCDLYTIQGYLFFFRREYARSVQSLSEAASLTPDDATLARHLEKARAQLTEEQMAQLLQRQLKSMKDLYARGNYQAALVYVQKILSFDAENAEALAYQEDIQRRVNEPIVREMKIAKAKMTQKQYFEAVMHLQQVLKLDPQNQEAETMMMEAINALEQQARYQNRTKSGAEKSVEVTVNSTKSRELYSQGLLLYSQGKINEAASIWKESLNYDGDNTLARNAYNRALMELEGSN